MTTPAGAAAPGVPSADGKPTFHHMDHSQSLRVLWLLEELGVQYTLVLHTRVKSRSPPSLFAVHSLGKAPIFVTAGGIVVTETATIIEYILRHYDSNGRFSLGTSSASAGFPTSPTNDNTATPEAEKTHLDLERAWLKQESLTSFSGSTLGPTIMVKMILHIAVTRGPFLLRPLFQAVYMGMDGAFIKAEIEKQLAYLESQLGEDEWFSGRTEPGKADFMLSWPGDQLQHRKYLDKKTFAKFNAWLERVQARPAYKKALELGNGYDLNSL